VIRPPLVAVLAAVLLVGAGAGTARAQRLTFEALGGGAYNAPVPLTVRQTGFPDIHVTARYATKPLGPYAPYFSWRLALWNADHTAAWELVQLHHRLFLTNNPPEIQFFAIHFGYNFFMAGRVWQKGHFLYHVDAGLIVCNPENTVRGMVLNTRHSGLFDAGYDLDGWGGQVAVSRNVDLLKHVYATGNVALVLGRARVPVVDGSADVPNVSLHGEIGLGVRF
jgi:hypothetical protein